MYVALYIDVKPIIYVQTHVPSTIVTVLNSINVPMIEIRPVSYTILTLPTNKQVDN